MYFSCLSEFNKEFEKLLKKYKTLEEDLNNLKQFLSTYPKGFPPIIFPVSDLGIEIKVFKVKKFRCKYLKGSGSDSGIRIIYAYFKHENKIEFIEIYFKGNKSNHDKDRILSYYKKHRWYKRIILALIKPSIPVVRNLSVQYKAL